jgi:transposase-like protein
MEKEGGHRRYDAEFKKETVRLVAERGLTVKEGSRGSGHTS